MPPAPLPARDWPIPPMDKAAGHKDTAFTWAMGNLILARIAEGAADAEDLSGAGAVRP